MALAELSTWREFLEWYAKSQERWEFQQQERERQWEQERQERQRQWEQQRQQWEKERQEEREQREKERERWEQERQRQQQERERWEQEQREQREKERQREREQREQREKERARARAEYEEQQKALAAQMAETGRKIAALSENVGGLNRSVGELIETLIAAHLWEKFPEYDLQRAYRRLRLYDEKNVARAEIDILLANTDWAMAVEVKREVNKGDIDWHIERMARVLQYPPAELKLRPGIKLLSAIAGGVVEPQARDYAHKHGFFVLELAGESVVRLPEPPEFKPAQWQK